MQKKELAKRAARDSDKSARNATRALRRVKREEEVSDDEEYEIESEAGASVNQDNYSVGSISFFNPSTGTTQLLQRDASRHLLNLRYKNTG